MRGEMSSEDPLLVSWLSISRKDSDSILASFQAERRLGLERSLHRFEIEAEAQELQERDSIAGHSPWLARLIEDVLTDESAGDGTPSGIKPRARQALIRAHEAAEQSGAPLRQPSLVELLLGLLPRFRRVQ